MNRPLNLAILISGGGTTLLNLHERIQQGKLQARMVCVVSSSARAAGVSRAQALGYAVQVVKPKRSEDPQSYSQRIHQVLASHDVDLIVLGGFLRLFYPPRSHVKACINIHPALIPAFCGKGYYGMRVHQAVWDKGCRVSGCTVHFVNEEYDAGAIIIQRAVNLSSTDDPEAIRAKVFAAECEALPEAINLFAEGRILWKEGRILIADPDDSSSSG